MRFQARWSDESDRSRHRPSTINGRTMLDIVFIATGLAFFGLAAGYAVLCERL
jgi:hypothetical protein